MSEVLLTGATGNLGRALVSALGTAGHETRPMSRRPGGVVADLATGQGLAEAVLGADAVIHAASDPADPQAVDVQGTRALTEACAAAGVGHLIYVSIIGVDRNPYPYYQAKLEAERIVARSGVPYSIIRGGQFHEFVEQLLSTRFRRGRMLFLPIGFSAQPLAVKDFGTHLVQRLDAGPSGAITEYVGPQRLTGRELVRAFRVAGRMRGPALPVLVRGKVGRAFRMQSNIGSPDAPRGQIGWTQWLREHPQGTEFPAPSHDAG